PWQGPWRLPPSWKSGGIAVKKRGAALQKGGASGTILVGKPRRPAVWKKERGRHEGQTAGALPGGRGGVGLHPRRRGRGEPGPGRGIGPQIRPQGPGGPAAQGDALHGGHPGILGPGGIGEKGSV